jgi:ATP-dependent Zn protease
MYIILSYFEIVRTYMFYLSSASSVFKKAIFILITLVSIPNLYADTNDPEQSDTLDLNQQLAAQEQPPQALTITLAHKCRYAAQALEEVTLTLFSIQVAHASALMAPITNILSLCSQAKDLPDTASGSHIYAHYKAFTQAATALLDIAQNNFDNLSNFTLDMSMQESSSESEIAAARDHFNGIMAMLSTKVHEMLRDMLANIQLNVRNQLNKLDGILQTINTNISNSTTIVNKEDIKKEIMGLRNMLQQIKREISVSGVDPQKIMMVFKINQLVVSYLQDAQESKFKQWVSFDLANEVMRHQNDENQEEGDILSEIQKFNKELDQLASDAEKIDLTAINRAARFLDDYIVTPINKYDLVRWGTLGAGTVSFATLIAYYFDETFATQPTSLLRRLFGYPIKPTNPTIDPHLKREDIEALVKALFTQVVSKNINFLESLQKQAEKDPVLAKAFEQLTIGNRELNLEQLSTIELLQLLLNVLKKMSVQPLIPLSKIEQFVNVNNLGKFILGSTLAYFLYKEYGKAWAEYSPKLLHKFSLWFNKLKGGSYTKISSKFDELLPSTNFDDVIGLEYAKSQVYGHLKYIKDPERWDADELTPPTGILLTGKTRAGKTFFAKAICGEIHKQNPDKNIRFLSLDAHDIKERPIQHWMLFAKMFAPCVLFIDEIDLLNLQRTGDRTLLADFLQAMSGIADKDPKKQVIIIGTTNKPENLDTALVQPGRLALEIRFEYPTFAERKLFITKRLNKFAIDPVAFDIDVDSLARQTHDKSFEDIKMMLDSAFIHIGIQGQTISQETLEWALDNKLRKIVDVDTKQVSEQEMRLLAAHYAGQALAHILLDLDEKIAKITTRQVVVKVKEESVYDQYYGKEKQTGLEQGAIFTYLEQDTYDVKSHQELAKKAKTLLAARMAERIVTNNCSTLFGWKKNAAFNMIKTLVTDGIDFQSLSKGAQDATSDTVQAKLKEFEDEMHVLLMEHKDALIALTNALQIKQTLTFHEIMVIVNAVDASKKIDAIPVAVA